MSSIAFCCKTRAWQPQVNACAAVVLRGEDLAGGGLSLDESFTVTGGHDRAAANKSMQVWDKDGRRISSRRLAVSGICPIPLKFE